MKFIADNIRELSRKNKERNIKRSIRLVKNKIKLRAKDGDNMCTVDLYENFDDSQQETIGNYFIKRGFKVEWNFNDQMGIRWV